LNGDEGDIEKNKKHRVEDKEAEEVFFDNNKVIFPDIIHSTEDEEREFWAKLDLSEYYEPSDMERVSFPNLKPTSCSISIRIPEYLLSRVKERANEINVPYQSLIKGYIKKGELS